MTEDLGVGASHFSPVRRRGEVQPGAGHVFAPAAKGSHRGKALLEGGMGLAVAVAGVKSPPVRAAGGGPAHSDMAETAHCARVAGRFLPTPAISVTLSGIRHSSTLSTA